MKQWIKSHLLPAFDSLLHPSAGPRAVVLCYHSVHATSTFASVTPRTFESHLAWLKEACDVVPFHSILSLRRSDRLERPAVALTFDDGYADNYEYVYPLLTRYGLSATFFLTTGLIDRLEPVVQRLMELRRCPKEGIRPMEWGQIREMRRHGLFFGAHTVSHPNLAELSRADAEWELATSKRTLEQRLGEEVRLMAYPFGKPGRHFTDETLVLAQQLGYEFAGAILFRGLRPDDDPLRIPRFFITGDSLQTLQEKISGRWDLLGAWQAKAPRWAARVISPGDFRYGTAAHRTLVS